MRSHRALAVMAAAWLTAPAAAADDAHHPRPARHAKPSPRTPVRPASPGTAATTPLFPEGAPAATAAERAAALERRRKAFFAAPAEKIPADEPGAPPVGVTLGGSGGLTPGMGLRF